jgi:hypothetical protein
MERINNTVIITLDFFEIINGFEKEGETDKPGCEEDNCEHISAMLRRNGQIGCRIGQPSSIAHPAPPATPATLSK